MGFPTRSTKQSKLDAIFEAQTIAARLKQRAQSIVNQLATSNIQGTDLVSEIAYWKAQSAKLNALKSIPGIVAVAEAELGETGLAAAFNAMTDAMDAIVEHIATNLPTDANDNLLLIQIDPATNTVTYRVFTPPQTSSLRAVFQALIATID